MWILSQSNYSVVNSNQVKIFGIIGNTLWADDVARIGVFGTEDEAKKELKQIYDALIVGQESYSVG